MHRAKASVQSAQVAPVPLTDPRADDHASEQRVVAMINSIGEAVIATDRSGAVAHMNPAAVQFTGLELDEAAGRPIEEVVRLVDSTTRESTVPGAAVAAGTSLRASQRLTRQLIEASQPSAVHASGSFMRPKLTLIARDGATRDVAATCTPIRDGGEGGDAGYVLVLRDTTEERRADEAMRRSEESFRALIEQSPDLILVHREGRIVYANASAMRSLGYESREELESKGFAEILHEDDRDLASMGSREAADAGRSLATRWLCKDGSARSTEMAFVPLAFDGSPSVVVVARDVTERNEIQAQLLRVDRMAALGTLSPESPTRSTTRSPTSSSTSSTCGAVSAR